MGPQEADRTGLASDCCPRQALGGFLKGPLIEHLCESLRVSGGQDPPHLRERVRHFLRESEGDPARPMTSSSPDRGPSGGPPRSRRARPERDRIAGPPIMDEGDRGVPIGLTRGQVGDPIVSAPEGIAVLAWVPFTGGAYHRVEAWAGQWTRHAVRIRFYDHAGAWDLWIHACDVQRRSIHRIAGPPATMRPDTISPIHPSRRPSRE